MFKHCFLLLWASWALCNTLGAQTQLQQKIIEQVGKGSVVLKQQNGEYLIRYRADQPLIPASVLKIPLAAAALDLLGEQTRLHTEFYTNADQDLMIRGLGDPGLTSNEIRRVAQNLKKQGFTQFRKLVLNIAAFERVVIPGVTQTSDPYNALNGALAVNFNTMFLAVDKQGRISSAEKETPLTPSALIKGKSLPKGKKSRVNLGSSLQDSLRYAAELFTIIFAEQQIIFENQGFEQQSSLYDWDLVYTHYNQQTVAGVVKGMLKYSNNYTANQLIMLVGAEYYGYPTSLQKGVNAFSLYLRMEHKLQEEDFFIEEGSGISAKNRIKASAMIKILENFRAYAHLMPEFQGTLTKTGTLSGAYNLAGYLVQPGKLLPYVILTNHSVKRRTEVLNLLKELL